jgi:hypothetical protein
MANLVWEEVVQMNARMHPWVPLSGTLLGSGECGKTITDGKLAQTELDTIFATNCRRLPEKQY